MEEHIARIRALAARRGCDYALARTDQSYLELFTRLA